MGIFDWKHWIVLLIVVVLVFGTKKLKNLGGDLGESIKGFRKAMSDEEHKPAEYTPPPAPPVQNVQPVPPVHTPQPVQNAQPVPPVQPAPVQPTVVQPVVPPVEVAPAPAQPHAPVNPGHTLEGQATPVQEPQRKD